MDTSIYKSNSNKQKEEQREAAAEDKKLEKLVRTPVKMQKKNFFRQFADDFITEDAPNIKTYIVKDVLIPGIKKTIIETIEMIFWGSSRKGKSPLSKVSYRSFYDEPRTRAETAPRLNTFSYDEVVIENRGDAENVLNAMCDLIDTYQIASVADLNEFLGVNGNYTDNKYGWTNLSTAEVVRARGGGYMLKMPRAMPIK